MKRKQLELILTTVNKMARHLKVTNPKDLFIKNGLTIITKYLLMISGGDTSNVSKTMKLLIFYWATGLFQRRLTKRFCAMQAEIEHYERIYELIYNSLLSDQTTIKSK